MSSESQFTCERLPLWNFQETSTDYTNNLLQQLQVAVLAGIAVMVVAMPLNTIVIKKMRAYSMQNMKNKDERMKMMNEVLNGMKVGHVTEHT